MARKLTEKELELLNELYSDTELGCRGFIRRFIIRNTYEPKYKVGDYVKVVDNSSRIWGCVCNNVNAKIVNISWWLGSLINKGEEMVQYECVCYDQFGKEHTLFAEESVCGNYQKRHISGYSDTDQNTFEKKSECSDSTDL